MTPRPSGSATGSDTGVVPDNSDGRPIDAAGAPRTSAPLRPATAADRDVLTAMLVLAAGWAGHPVDPTVPELVRYVTGWPRAGDLGVVAEDGEPIGAAWLRVFAPDDPGYGFVRADVPEISMAVAPEYRGRGVGRALLRNLVATAARAGVGAVSLSVERANPAARLYRAEGFVVVTRGPDSDTMWKSL